LKKILLVTAGVVLIAIISVTALFFYKTSAFSEISGSDFIKGEGIVNPSYMHARSSLFMSKTVMRPFFREYVQGLYIGKDEIVLNFGSGSGAEAEHIAEVLSKGNGHLTCLDISRGWLKVAEKNLKDYKNVSFLLGDIRDLKIKDGSFDSVVIHFVLHDIPENIRKDTVGAIVKSLKPGGSIYIREPMGDGHGIPEKSVQDLIMGNGLRLKSESYDYLFFMGKLYSAHFEK
jgi:ubiquinone/menaquinone biosynthesis C-methylase UbiE